MPVTATDITNRALQLIGTRTDVDAAELAGGTSNEAIQATIALAPVISWCYGLANWNFARRTAALTVAKGPPPANPGAWHTAYPSPPWLYEYTLPGDFVRAIYVTNSDTAANVYLGEPKRFALGVDNAPSTQQEVLLSNDPGVVLIYTCQVSDFTNWPWYFERLVVPALASTMCIALTGDRKLYEELSAMTEQQISISLQANAAEGLIIEDNTPESIQMLGINYPYRRFGMMAPPQAPSPKRRPGGGQDQ